MGYGITLPKELFDIHHLLQENTDILRIYRLRIWEM